MVNLCYNMNTKNDFYRPEIEALRQLLEVPRKIFTLVEVNIMITQKRLKELFTYNKDTGIFIRNTNISQCKIGDIAGSVSKQGYLTARADGKLYQLTHLAWLYIYGTFPEKLIRFRNGIKTDVSIDNLFTPAVIEDSGDMKCTVCEETKDVSMFMLRSNSKIKRRSMCTECAMEKNTEKNRTSSGVVEVIYNSQKINSKNRGHVNPDYSLEDLKIWLFSQKLFHTLYLKWVDSGYEKDLKPSVDRLDDYKPYTMDNIQLVTWRENYRKAHKDKINRINTKSLVGVIQYSKNGDVIKIHNCILDAANSTNTSSGNIINCCKGLRNTTGGFKWKYKEKNYG